MLLTDQAHAQVGHGWKESGRSKAPVRAQGMSQTDDLDPGKGAMVWTVRAWRVQANKLGHDTGYDRGSGTLQGHAPGAARTARAWPTRPRGAASAARGRPC